MAYVPIYFICIIVKEWREDREMKRIEEGLDTKALASG